MSNKVEQITKLLQEWKNERKYPTFVNDGILRLEAFEKQNPKILFLLKESNGDFQNIAPLAPDKVGYGPDGNSPLFWRYMRGYEYIISCVYGNLEFSPDELQKVILQPNVNTAYVNIKKQCDNKPVSSDADILNYAEKDKEFLLRQIELIGPDVIYCAGTYKYFHNHMVKLIRKSERVWMFGDVRVINYYHLAHRFGYKTFNGLKTILENSLKTS